MPPENDSRLEYYLKRLGSAVKQLMMNEDVPPEERLEGIFLLMNAHGLPCDPKRQKVIRKCWTDYASDQARKKHQQKRRRKTN